MSRRLLKSNILFVTQFHESRFSDFNMIFCLKLLSETMVFLVKRTKRPMFMIKDDRAVFMNGLGRKVY